MRSWLYHPNGEAKIFEDEDACALALAEGWADSPYQFGVASTVVQPASLEPDESEPDEPITPKKKGGRPRKVIA